ncbi:MAG: UDP-glucose 4-epimerase GalE [Actinotignum sanguinis]|uniref:UDP-glucose 4-epimerase GalE n=1 Tax=Actinotignum sanguinis TaxID=1445614 RepID=UPI00254E161E|nr:UDP-glucose 4-epimerase GalE [Actinotignum sanguinis]MDK8286735.1 UDP-glucose 4-epimerase GalE [Actinotignum sanguinis]MDK8352645.1 UDP-glucose 4-epimerase GalE [Actinotignum sanguinis]MDK8651572.1 UDP-glucose 4-epimerase GalE [Actinotignum sanguinis]MDK8802003.1 UDP-glucose 4-epimerase GalE [Actinotignum sanguinis]
MTTVLVAGGAGYIGTHTSIELLEQGYDVVCVDNYANSSPEAVERVRRITDRDLPAYSIDVRDVQALDEVFTRHEIDWVIYFAGFKAVGESVAHPLKYYENNIGGALALLSVMRAHSVKKMVFSSSATVYGDPVSLPLTEESPAGMATNPYGQTKVMTEQILEDIQKADPEWTVVLLRYFNPIGAHPSGLIGEDPKGIPANLTPYVAKVVVGELDHVQVFGGDYDTPDGTGVRDYIHVVDLARGHVAAVDKVTSPGVYIYNLGTGHGSSVLEVIHAYEKVAGMKIPYRVVARRPGDIAASYADASKAARELGWRATHSLDEMAASSLHWQKMNPAGLRG